MASLGGDDVSPADSLEVEGTGGTIRGMPFFERDISLAGSPEVEGAGGAVRGSLQSHQYSDRRVLNNTHFESQRSNARFFSGIISSLLAWYIE